MSARELATRVQYRLVLDWERRRHRRGAVADPDRLEQSLIPALRGAGWQQRLLAARSAPTAGKYLPGVHAGTAMRALLQDAFARECGETLEHAARTRDRHFEFFGAEFNYGATIDWQADPVTGQAWPGVYHADVPVHGGDTGSGDVKHVWELSRQQYLIDLAKAHFLTGNDADLRAMQELVGSWIHGNPYATGVNWSCALEPAFRAWSWLWAYYLTADALDPEFHLEWLRGFYDHGRFLHRHLEHYSSPFNHLIGEAAALYTLGCCFTEFRESEQWRRRGRQVLETRLDEQFYADGGSVEQSLFYHHATTGFYLLAALVARANGVELSPRIWSAIERGIEFSMTFVQPDGSTPEIGGADDGKPIRLEHLPFWDFRPYYAIGAVLFGRGDFKTAAGRFWEDAAWLLGAEGHRAFASLPAQEPPRSRALPHSGYAVWRSGWSADADYVCFDCGPQAAGLRRDDVPSAAHGHADCLSAIATLGGHPVLVDPGFYCYNGPSEWEVHFRKTAAHNTVTIDGRDQARHVSKMAWTHTYAAELEGFAADAAVGWARGSHDGFADAGHGVVHRRTVWLRPGGYLILYDEITGRAGHVARANYQFAPGGLELTASDSALFANRFELSWACSAPARAAIVDDGERPADGWIAPSLGVRQRAPRLVLEVALPVERVVLLAVLADRERAADAAERRVLFPQLVVEAGPIIGACVRGPAWEDQIVAGDGRTIHRWRAVETDAAIAVVRLTGLGVEDSRRAGGTLLRVTGQHAALAPPANGRVFANGRA